MAVAELMLGVVVGSIGTGCGCVFSLTVPGMSLRDTWVHVCDFLLHSIAHVQAHPLQHGHTHHSIIWSGRSACGGGGSGGCYRFDAALACPCVSVAWSC